MYTEVFNLWENTPGRCEEVPTITYYKPENKTSKGAVVIYPGGGYGRRAEHEGGDYAEFLAQNGITAFVTAYRVHPHTFPIQLSDARRSVRFVRYYAEKFGIDKSKVAVMGSSAGGHLASFVSTYKDSIDFEDTDAIDGEDFIPNAQVLCYPVINLYDKNITHFGTGDNLVGNSYQETNDVVSRRKFSPNLLVDENTPQAFIWHTLADETVSVKNSLEYINALKDHNIPAELHIFPHGRHGLGLAKNDNEAEKHTSQWSDLLIRWFKYIGW